MPENPYRAPQVQSEPSKSSREARQCPTDDGLGPVVLACRGRSTKEFFFEIGWEFSYLRTVCALTFVVYLGLGSVLGILLGILLKMAGTSLGSTGVGMFLAITGALSLATSIWLANREPRRSRLTLHEHGFRYKETDFRFDDLQSIVIGRDAPKHKRSEYRQAIDDATLTITWKNGYSRNCPGLLLAIKREDADEFFDRIRTRYPALVTARKTERGMGDFDFRMSQVG